MDLIIIYPKPYSIYVRGTIAVLMHADFRGSYRDCMGTGIGILEGLCNALDRQYTGAYKDIWGVDKIR